MKATVVIASPDGSPIRHRDDFLHQANACDADVIAVYTDGRKARAELFTTRNVRELPITQPAAMLTPYLWQVGIENSSGDVVVLTLNGLVPQPGWIAALVDSYATAEAKVGALGGSIAPAAGVSLVDRAIALSRYSAFLPPLERTEVHDIAADNASYRREAIACCADLIGDGFWEPPIHERMRANGWKLMTEPAAQMTHESTNGFASFIRQRLKHGRRFGSDRRKGVTTGWVLKYLILSPLVPLVLALRTLSRMRAKGRGPGEWLSVLPLLLCFNVAWTLGEVLGTIAPHDAAASQKNNGMVS